MGEFVIHRPAAVLFAAAAAATLAAAPQPTSAQPAAASPAAPAEASVPVPREVLERYVGRYAINGAVLTVGVSADGRLTAELSGQPPHPPLRAVSASEFSIDAIGARLLFDGEGPKATRVTSRFAGNEVVGTRLPQGAIGPAAVVVDATARTDVVRSLGAALRQRYVFPETGDRAAARIEAALAAGEYDSLSDPAALAARLTGDLAAVANDKHLLVNSMSTPPPPPSGGGMPLPPSESGVVRADRLSGGVGYLEIVAIPRPPALKPVIDPIMAALADSTALIVDLRRNIGGAPDGVAYLASYLAPPGQPLHLDDVITRVEGASEVARQPYFTQPVPFSFSGRPVLVLTSSRTFSAGESLAYDVQAHRLGTVVGEVTGGGGNLTGPAPLGHGLMAMIPIARAENAVTGTNWEGSGVAPDVAVAADRALAAALRRLGQPAVADIAVASQQQLFAPRTAPLPGSEDALRRALVGLLREPADLAAFGTEPAEMLRPQLPQVRGELRSLGAIASVRFIGTGIPAGDAFEVAFTNGTRAMNVILAPDGSVEGFSMRPAAPGS